MTILVTKQDQNAKTKLPMLYLLAVVWMLTVDSLAQIQMGPLSASGVLTVAGLLLALGLGPLIFLNRFRLSGIRSKSATPVTLTLFATYAIIRFIATPTSDGLQNVAVYVTFIITIGLTITQVTEPSSLIVSRRMRYIAVIVSLVFLITFVSGIELYKERPFALVGLIFMATLIPFKPRRLIFRLAPFIVATAIALSLSRTATAIALVMLIFLSVRGRRGFRLITSFVLAGLAAAVAYSLFNFYAPFRDRFIGGDNAATLGGVDLNTSGRAVLWEMTIKSAEENPLFGNGPGSASALISGAFRNISHPHNEYLRLFHDFGWIGAILFVLGMLVIQVQTLRRAIRSENPIHWSATLALAAVMVAAFTDNVIVYPFVMIPLGVLAGASLGLPLEGRPPSTNSTTHRRP